MIARLGMRISSVFRATTPDPFVLAVILLAVTAVLAVGVGFVGPDGSRADIGSRCLRTIGVLGAGGMWSLLAFSMQMCLILVTGHALATSRPVRAMVAWGAGLPRSGAAGAAMVAFVSAACGLLNWGLGLIVGAFLAREVGRSLERRGIAAHYPLIAAAGYMGLMVWHGGLSGSAPLTSTTWATARTVLPGSFVDTLTERVGGEGIDLSRTIGSSLNLVTTGGLLVLAPVMFWFLAPRAGERVEGAGDFVPQERRAETEVERGGRLPEFLERSPVVVWVLAFFVVGGLVRFAQVRGGLATISPNEVNAAMLALGLVLHGSARSYVRAVEEAALGCAGIILQFPIYAAILGIMRESGLVQMMADGFVAVGTERTLPFLAFASAAIINLFVPSGGGQWAVQGPVVLQAGLDAGVDPAKMVMAVAYGDQLTNMLQPFWALPLLAITGVKARDIVGYTAIVMIVAGAWIALGLLVL